MSWAIYFYKISTIINICCCFCEEINELMESPNNKLHFRQCKQPLNAQLLPYQLCCKMNNVSFKFMWLNFRHFTNFYRFESQFTAFCCWFYSPFINLCQFTRICWFSLKNIKCSNGFHKNFYNQAWARLIFSPFLSCSLLRDGVGQG